jgi:hypothetical protein
MNKSTPSLQPCQHLLSIDLFLLILVILIGVDTVHIDRKVEGNQAGTELVEAPFLLAGFQGSAEKLSPHQLPDEKGHQQYYPDMGSQGVGVNLLLLLSQTDMPPIPF